MGIIHFAWRMGRFKFIYYSIALLYCILAFNSCFAEYVDNPEISSYVKDLYIENADESKTYYIRQIRRNVNGVWLVTIGSANSVLEDKPDGSSQVLSYSLGKNIEGEKVLSLNPVNGYSGRGYIVLDWNKIPEGKEIFCRSKINPGAFILRKGGDIDLFLKKDIGANSNLLLQNKLKKLESVRTKWRNRIVTSADVTIKVSNQTDFNKLNESLNAALKMKKKNIVVEISDGQYNFKEAHLSLIGINDPNLSIKIRGGDKTVLVGASDAIAKKHLAYDHRHAYLSADLENRDLWSGVKQMKDTVEIVDAKAKICRIKSVESIRDQLHPKCKIKLTSWFRVFVYDVLKIENGYIYFHAPDLIYTDWLKCYSVNRDWGYGKKYPRYRLFEEANVIREPLVDCSSSQFLNIEKCKLNNFMMENIRFRGNALLKASLISIKDVVAKDIRVSNCSFSSIRSQVIGVSNSQNVTLEGNLVNDCYVDCFVSDNTSVGFVVKGNTFRNNGLDMNNSACVIARGKDFTVMENTFCDFSYAAISVGMNFQWKKDAICSGIVEGNDIHYSSEYYNNPQKYCLMDGGAIYVMTQLDDVIIRYNRIYDYRGMGANRGIFCDDGTKNVSLYGNVITNVPNSFSIDLRICPQVSDRVPDHNQNILMMYNLVDMKYRFQGSADKSAFLGPNYLISKGKKGRMSNEVLNVSSQGGDCSVDGYSEIGSNHIYLSDDSKTMLMQSPIGSYIKRYISK